MKILVIFTGGTIASKSDGGKISLNDDKYLLIRQFKEVDSRNIEFFYLEPYFILSESMNYNNWEALINTLLGVNFDTYDGIIITHGTDTLAYTANILSFTFSNKKIPICLVSSGYPLDNSNANGLDNFLGAIDFIEKTKLQGIYVFYKQNDELLVHLGSRVQQCRNFTDDFQSMYNVCFGTMNNGLFIYNDNELNVPIEEIKKLNCSMLVSCNLLKLNPMKKILLIYPYVGLDYSSINIDFYCAVMHATYHAGTVSCSKEENNSVLSLIAKCKEKNIDIYLSPIKKNQVDTGYATTYASLENGIIPLSDISLEAAYAKLFLAYQFYNDKEKIKNILNTNIFFERV